MNRLPGIHHHEMVTEPTPAPDGAISSPALDQLFREARTLRHWIPPSIPLELLKEIYDLARLGPTSSNCCPARFLFLVTSEAKERLVPALSPGNVDKTRTAPVTVVIAWDSLFYEKFPFLTSGREAPDAWAANPERAHETAFRNGSLQGAYFILAARAMGLDCGPMSGFNAKKVNAEFFPDGRWRANFLCNLGYGDRTKLFPRQPRLPFEDACQLL
ncbi:MAG TPA: malonic semialdehyde reductase [Bryobacteraceae bacterium]